MDRGRVRALMRLARWLGPWTSEHARPRVLRRRVRIGGERIFDAWLYEPARAIGTILVVPGLHYLGPADPRLDRFLAILADAGLLVLCPFLPEFRALSVGPSLVEDCRASFRALRAHTSGPIGVLSISFGSFPAIRLAASEPGVNALVLFGGYSSFEEAIRFSLEGDGEQPHDPLNRPVVFLNLREHIPNVAEDERAPLAHALRTYVRRTWGRPEMKARKANEALARDMAGRLPPSIRELFLIATGVLPGGSELAQAALETARASFAHLDPLPYCASITVPTTIVHGRDDDVIPHTHAAELARAIPHARVLLTGLYGHTGHGIIDPRALASEVRTMAAILESIVACGTGESAA